MSEKVFQKRHPLDGTVYLACYGLLTPESDTLRTRQTHYRYFCYYLAEFPINFKPKLHQYFCDIVLYLLKLSLHNYELAQYDGRVLVGSIVYLALKTVEQVEDISAEEYLDWIVEKCEINGGDLF